MSMRGSPIRGL